MGRVRNIKNTGDFLQITAQLDHSPFAEEENLVQQLNRVFPSNELFFSIHEGTIILHLAVLEPDSFKSQLSSLQEAAGLKKKYQETGLLDPFENIFTQVLSIGSYGIRYGKRIYIRYADERKVQGRKQKVVTRGQHYYANDHQFSKVKNPCPEDMINSIICADSEDVLASLPDNCIDLIITSPPYNFGIQYDGTDDGVDWNAYLDTLFRIFSQGIRVLAYGGRFIVNVQPLFSDYIPLHHIISSFFMQQKMIWKGEILWEKNNYNCKYCSWGSWKSPSSPYLKYTWEYIEVFCKGDLKKEGRREDIDISDEEFKNWVVARWSIGPERRMKQYNHPAMFPEELVERCLKLFSYQNDIILDPFNGAGTTTMVAAKLKRRFVGIEQSEEYCRTAQSRLQAVKKRTEPDDQTTLFSSNDQE